jgi:tetratricopeptide (TPR) repeat protein
MRARPRFGLLIVLLCAEAANAYGQAAGVQGLERLSWPGTNWSLDVALPSFDVLMQQPLKDGSGFFLIARPDVEDKDAVRAGQLTIHSGRVIMLTIQMETAKAAGGDRDFRDFTVKTLKKSERINIASVKTFEHKQIPALRYSMLNQMTRVYPQGPVPPGGMSPTGRGMEAFFVKDDVWITFRLNGIAFKNEDEQLFYAVLDSVKFTDTSAPSSSFDYLSRGKSLIRQKLYAEAAAELDIALDMERKQRQLDVVAWRKLIGHLLDIHSATGDRARVKELLDYGVRNDPIFPIFHLGLAYYHAAQGDTDNTIAALEKAHSYRNNDPRTRGFYWIDPLSHPAFEPFRKNEKFRKAVKALKR